MGRQKIYKTSGEKQEAEKRWKREWYHRNSDRIIKANAEYYRQKNMQKLTLDTFTARAIRIHGEKYDYSKSIYSY